MPQRPLLVLAGGFGTRLRKVVGDVPKPLAPVCGQPLLHYLLQSWKAQGATRLLFLLHHEAGQIRSFLKAEQALLGEVVVEVLVEPSPLGTGGAVALAVQEFQLESSFLVANADTWLGSGLASLAEAVAPAIGVVTVDNTDRYGRVETGQGKVVSFAEKAGSSGRGMINAGLYHLCARDFADWDGQPFSIEQTLFPRLAGERRLFAVPLDTDFIDIGMAADYARFCRWAESGRQGTL